MRSTLDELQRELEDLKALVASITPVNAALADHEDSLVRRYLLVRRRFDYAAFVVALYASFEKFIESLVAAFASLESRRLEYARLPPKLVRKHMVRTAELLARGRIGEGRYIGLTELEVVRNLFECLNGVNPYTLNQAAVIAHDLNLRPAEIDVLFGALGIEKLCESVRWTDPMIDWYRSAQGLEAAPIDGVPASIVETRLDGIVQRRNQVAHGGGNPDDLLGADEMADAIGFIEAFALSVFSLAVGRYLQDHHVPSAIQLQQRDGDGPYKSGTIVVVESPAHRLYVGQPVFTIVGSSAARWGRIQNLRVDDEDVQVVDQHPPVANGVGIELNFRCPKGASLVVLSSDDDVVWSPRDAAAGGSPSL